MRKLLKVLFLFLIMFLFCSCEKDEVIYYKTKDILYICKYKMYTNETKKIDIELYDLMKLEDDKIIEDFDNKEFIFYEFVGNNVDFVSANINVNENSEITYLGNGETVQIDEVVFSIANTNDFISLKCDITISYNESYNGFLPEFSASLGEHYYRTDSGDNFRKINEYQYGFFLFADEIGLYNTDRIDRNYSMIIRGLAITDNPYYKIGNIRYAVLDRFMILKSNNLILLQNISRGFNQRMILHDLNFSIKKGEFVAILGNSGSGKTTLLNILGLLDKEFIGEYKLFGNSILPKLDYTKLRAVKIGFIFQLYYLLPKLNIVENIMLPLLYQKHIQKTEIQERLDYLYEKLDLKELEGQAIETLSGGEKQRVAIARALIHNPEIIICDEPTGNLDALNAERVLDILKAEQKKGKTIIVVTHSLGLSENADTVYELEGGALIRRK